MIWIAGHQLRFAMNDYRNGRENDLNFSERSRCTVWVSVLATCWRCGMGRWAIDLGAVRGKPWTRRLFRSAATRPIVAPSTHTSTRGQWQGWPESRRAPLRVDNRYSIPLIETMAAHPLGTGDPRCFWPPGTATHMKHTRLPMLAVRPTLAGRVVCSF